MIHVRIFYRLREKMEDDVRLIGKFELTVQYTMNSSLAGELHIKAFQIVMWLELV